jgi:hypothetical protein
LIGLHDKNKKPTKGGLFGTNGAKSLILGERKSVLTTQESSSTLLGSTYPDISKDYCEFRGMSKEDTGHY